MSQRGFEFLREWIRQVVNDSSYPASNETRAKVLAEQFAADAENAGIRIGEVEVEVGDLADFILAAMDEINLRAHLFHRLAG